MVSGYGGRDKKDAWGRGRPSKRASPVIRWPQQGAAIGRGGGEIAHTDAAIGTLAEICTDRSAPPSARVAASAALLDRGWGKPAQTVDTTIRQDADVTARAARDVPHTPRRSRERGHAACTACRPVAREQSGDRCHLCIASSPLKACQREISRWFWRERPKRRPGSQPSNTAKAMTISCCSRPAQIIVGRNRKASTRYGACYAGGDAG